MALPYVVNCYSFGSVSLSEYTHTCIHTHRGKKEIKQGKKIRYMFSLTQITYFIPFGNFLFYLAIRIRDKTMLFYSSNAFLFNSVFKVGNIHVAILLLEEIDIVSSFLPSMLKQSYILNTCENFFRVDFATNWPFRGKWCAPESHLVLTKKRSWRDLGASFFPQMDCVILGKSLCTSGFCLSNKSVVLQPSHTWESPEAFLKHRLLSPTCRIFCIIFI